MIFIDYANFPLSQTLELDHRTINPLSALCRKNAIPITSLCLSTTPKLSALTTYT